MAFLSAFDNASLIAAVKSAQAGDTVLLQSGNYNGLVLRDLNKTDVTIRSADLANRAVISDMAVYYCSGLRISDVDLKVGTTFAARVESSSDIDLNRVSVYGSLDNDPRNDSQGGLLIQKSKDIVVSDSEFQQLFWGLGHINCSGLVIRDNSFHDLRMDGVRGGGTSDILIERNFFTDFRPAGSEHVDAVQFWTTNTTASARNITVRDNLIVRGDGVPMQGVFLWDESGHPYENVVVTGNLAVGTTWRGITVASSRGALVTDNVVVGLPDQRSFIYAEHTTGLTMLRNGAMQYVLPAGYSLPAGNVVTTSVTDGGSARIAAWLSDRPWFTADETSPSGVVRTGTSASETLAGGAGDDSLHGADGNDVLIGGAGADLMDGGGWFDRADYSASTAAVAIDLVNGSTGGDAAGDRFVSIERFVLTAFADRFVGTTAAEALVGGAGNDTFAGGGGADQFSGGAGADLFVFGARSGAATIWDFAAGSDKIRIDAGATAFSDLTLVQEAGGVRVSWGVAGASVLLSGRTVAQLKTSDFVFATSGMVSSAPVELVGVAPDSLGAADFLLG